MLAPFECLCGNFILPEPASYVFFYAFSNLRNLLYIIEKTYEAHIDEEVHLYGLLHQLAFLAGKIKDRRDMENLIDTARRYGEIADQMFDRWSIPGRYLVFGDKADLARLKALELCELDAFYVEGEDDEDQPHA